MFHTAALYCLILYLFITYGTEMFPEVSFLTLFMHLFMHEILYSLPDCCMDFNIRSIFMVSYTSMMIRMLIDWILVIDV